MIHDLLFTHILYCRMRNYVSSTIHRQKSLPCTEGDTINNNSFQSFVTNLTLTLVVVTVSDFCRLFLCVLQEISLTTNASLYSVSHLAYMYTNLCFGNVMYVCYSYHVLLCHVIVILHYDVLLFAVL